MVILKFVLFLFSRGKKNSARNWGKRDRVWWVRLFRRTGSQSTRWTKVSLKRERRSMRSPRNYKNAFIVGSKLNSCAGSILSTIAASVISRIFCTEERLMEEDSASGVISTIFLFPLHSFSFSKIIIFISISIIFFYYCPYYYYYFSKLLILLILFQLLILVFLSFFYISDAFWRKSKKANETS